MKHLKVFTSKTCGPCKQMAPLLEDLGILIVKIDVDEQPQMAALHGIRTVPTLKLYHETTLQETVYGFQTKEKLLDLVNK